MTTNQQVLNQLQKTAQTLNTTVELVSVTVNRYNQVIKEKYRLGSDPKSRTMTLYDWGTFFNIGI